MTYYQPTERQQAKLNELRDYLHRTGKAPKIPHDRTLWAKMLRQLRLDLGLSSNSFWELFHVNASAGQKYNQLNPAFVRICPDHIMQRVADQLGLDFLPEDAEHIIEKRIANLDKDTQNIVRFIHQNNISLQDMHNWLKIKALFDK